MLLQDLLQNPEYKQKFVLEKFIQEVLHISREEMRTQMEKEISGPEVDQILRYYRSYVEDKKPMEYILWHVDFFQVPFIVNENTLIPRPETEYMITAVTEYTKENLDTKNQKWILMDIWTWCGVLWISVLLQNSDSYDQIFFSDLSTGALFVAQKNYENLIEKKYNSEFLQSDLVSFISDKILDINKPITLVANLPYIPDETFDKNSPDNVQKREPRMAFVWGNDWLDLYRKMFNQLFWYKSEWKIWFIMMFLEMMTRQVEILEKEFWAKLIFEEVKTFHFNIRIVKASFKD